MFNRKRTCTYHYRKEANIKPRIIPGVCDKCPNPAGYHYYNYPNGDIIGTHLCKEHSPW